MRLLKHILFLKSLELLPKQHKVRYIPITHVVCVLEYSLEKRKYLFWYSVNGWGHKKPTESGFSSPWKWDQSSNGDARSCPLHKIVCIPVVVLIKKAWRLFKANRTLKQHFSSTFPRYYRWRSKAGCSWNLWHISGAFTLPLLQLTCKPCKCLMEDQSPLLPAWQESC